MPRRTQAVSEECERLYWTLSDTLSYMRPIAKQAVLYCGACEAVIPYGWAAAGPVKNWPYCPVHLHKPLMVRSASPCLEQRRKPKPE